MTGILIHRSSALRLGRRSRPSVLLAAIAAASMVVAPRAALAQSSRQVNEANNPLTPKITANLQDQWASQLYDTAQRTNGLLLRGVVPLTLGGLPQILRATLPIATAPVGASDTETGLGDLNLFDLLLFKKGHLAFGIGPQLSAPTATSSALGTGKWQAGLAGVIIAPKPWGLAGALLTWEHSFAGGAGRATQNNLVAQPLVIRNLPRGWYLRSTASWTFDLARGNYVIPIGVGIGKVFVLRSGTTVNLFAEPQWTVAHSGVGEPRLQVFAGVNLQFPLGKR